MAAATTGGASLRAAGLVGAMRHQRSSQPIADYVAALIQSGAQLGAIINQMEQFARRSGERRTRPVVAVLSELIEGILLDPEADVELEGIERATQLLVEATEAIGHNLFFVDVDQVDEPI